MSLESRISNLEKAAAAKVARSDPLFDVRTAYEGAQMFAGIPAGPDGSPEREAQLERVWRLRAVLDTGDLSLLLRGDLDRTSPYHQSPNTEGT